MEAVSDRVDKLEFLMAQLIEERRESVKETDRRFEEIREFQKETDRQFKETDRRMQETDRRMQETDRRMQEINERMEEALARIEKDLKQSTQQWGNLSRKLGTMVEDLVYPSIGRIIKEKFGFDVNAVYLRAIRRLDDGREKEFDAYAVTKDCVFLNSTKSSLDDSNVKSFIADINAFRLFCPEYNDKPLIGMLASLHIDKSVIKQAEKLGYIALGIGEELMEVKNTEGFKPKLWHYRSQ
ncbi:hypothetical protein MCHI_002911 [Candidatus Magnetoovum chiemensis]|nr:hypothetical protein MCHI_002911 [Candidatus Magnetoovum chiemensis]